MNRVIVKDADGNIIDDFIASDDYANDIVESDIMKVEKINLTNFIKDKENQDAR